MKGLQITEPQNQIPTKFNLSWFLSFSTYYSMILGFSAKILNLNLRKIGKFPIDESKLGYLSGCLSSNANKKFYRVLKTKSHISQNESQKVGSRAEMNFFITCMVYDVKIVILPNLSQSDPMPVKIHLTIRLFLSERRLSNFVIITALCFIHDVFILLFSIASS